MSNISHNSMSFSPLDAMLCVIIGRYIKHFRRKKNRKKPIKSYIYICEKTQHVVYSV